MNQAAFEDFWYWINARHSIYLKKEAGEPKPWSRDYIFQQWKFCNVFRQLDKQTQFLVKELDSHKYSDPAYILFNIYLFRSFNWYPTFQKIGWVNVWSPEDLKHMFETWMWSGKPYTSGAYMLRGREDLPKYESIILTLNEIWDYKEQLITQLNHDAGASMEETYNVLMEYHFWGWGEFTTYQIVLDMTYSSLLEYPKDIDDWCAFGPGAKRGFREIWPDMKLDKREMLKAAKQLLSEQSKHRKPHVPVLSLQDIEFSLCELGKYRRIKAGGRGSQKYAGV